MPRFPPVAIALVVAVVVVGGAILASVLSGARAPSGIPTCGPELSAGPYGCVAFVSKSGSGSEADQAWLATGGLRFSLVRTNAGTAIEFTGGCNSATAPATVTRSTFDIGGILIGQKACPASRGARDDLAVALFNGKVGAVEQSDATLVVTNGTRRVVFAEVIAPQP